MISISKNVYSDNLDDIVHEYSNTYPRTIKMMPVDIKSSTYIDFNKENVKKDSILEVGHHVRILKCKYIFVKVYIQNWFEEVFVIKNVKNTFRGHMLLVVLTMKKLLERFTKKNCKILIK